MIRGCVSNLVDTSFCWWLNTVVVQLLYITFRVKSKPVAVQVHFKADQYRPVIGGWGLMKELDIVETDYSVID